MKPDVLLAVLLALSVVLAWLRLAWWQYKAPVGLRARAWRMLALLLLQPLCAAMLYFTLLPPTASTEAGTLVVITARGSVGADGASPASPAARSATSAGSDTTVALPEAPAQPGIARAPDLATALRRHPDTQRLRIIGAGLEARDRDATGGLPVSFVPGPLPRGIVRIDPSRRVAPGAGFAISGQVHDVAGGSVDLLDPAGTRVSTSPLPASGEFSLRGEARTAGPALFTLRVRDARHAVVESVEVPLVIAIDAAPRVLLLAGAPGPEVKYLRRWATDAGLSLQTRMGVGGGLQLGDAPVALDAASLRRIDLVVVDERSWAALDASTRAALRTAVRDGMGLLLRVTAPLPDATRRDWQAMGMALSAGSDIAPVQVMHATTDAPDVPGNDASRGGGEGDDAATAAKPSGTPIELTRRIMRIDATDATPLLRGDKGTALAMWRAEGRGRVATWTVTDSFRLVLAGDAARHGQLWSAAFATLARARADAAPRIDAWPSVQARMSLCRLGSKPQVLAPDGSTTTLLPDPASGIPPCAAFWPTVAGWHVLRQAGGTDAMATRDWPFFVQAADATPGLRAVLLRDATALLAVTGHGTSDAATTAGSTAIAATTTTAAATTAANDAPRHRGASWPWFLAWLASAAALWWLERSRIGRMPGSDQPGTPM